MKLNQWTLGLAAAGVISLGSVAGAEEATSQVLTALSSTTLSGYVDTSAIWKFGTGAGLVGRAFDGTGKQDGFNLNVVKLTLEKPLDEGQWSAGYKVDLLFGPDATGFNQVAGNNGFQDFGIKQAYVALRAPVGNGLDFKMGVFDTIIGYEVFEAGNNPNYSRSWGWQLEPTQHTGILASYRVADFLSVAAGIANTWNAGINGRAARAGGFGATGGGGTAAESEKTYMASVTLTAPESLGFLKGAALYGGVVNGLNNASGASGGTTPVTPGDTTSLYAGVTVPTPLEGLGVGAAYDYRASNALDGFGNRISQYANAVSAYVTYQHDKWKFANRTEYTSASNGTWYLQAGATDTRNELFGNTTTVDYSLWANVISRLEFRWDHDLRARRTDVGGAAPYGFDDKNAISVALNVIYKF